MLVRVLVPTQALLISGMSQQLTTVHTGTCDVDCCSRNRAWARARPACIDGLPAPLQQQQLIEGLKDVDAGLVDGADNGAARVNNVAHCPHHYSSCPSIQT